ncbi:MAG: 30S ribosomal protein S20 [Lactobacillaceae bacterium]|jgi:small subunit ribosomal protein S20|nr:30S ribosomal protein S20 [Lactobacillaceae bacterium]
MPIIESSIQRVRSNEVAHARRQPQKSAYRAAVKKFEKAAAAGTADQALLQVTSSAIDKAETKGLIKKNKASRDKSRLAKLLASK